MRKSKRGPNKHHSLGNMQEDKPSKVGESGSDKASGETQEGSGFRGSWGSCLGLQGGVKSLPHPISS